MTRGTYREMYEDLESRGCQFFDDEATPEGKIAVFVPFVAGDDLPSNINIGQITRIVRQYGVHFNVFTDYVKINDRHKYKNAPEGELGYIILLPNALSF